VWCAPGRNSATLAEFFTELGPRKHSIRAVSIDMSGEYQRAIRDAVPDAQICFDPFVRHEALPVRAGCKTLPPGCRGSPVKLRAA
jgi:transposase